MSFVWNTFQFFHSFYWLPAPLTACEQHPLLIFLWAYALNFVTVNISIWKFNHYAGSAMRISLLLLKKGQDFLWHVKLDLDYFSPSNINSSKSIVHWIWRYKEYFFYLRKLDRIIHTLMFHWRKYHNVQPAQTSCVNLVIEALKPPVLLCSHRPETKRVHQRKCLFRLDFQRGRLSFTLLTAWLSHQKFTLCNKTVWIS